LFVAVKCVVVEFDMIEWLEVKTVLSPFVFLLLNLPLKHLIALILKRNISSLKKKIN